MSINEVYQLVPTHILAVNLPKKSEYFPETHQHIWWLSLHIKKNRILYRWNYMEPFSDEAAVLTNIAHSHAILIEDVTKFMLKREVWTNYEEDRDIIKWNINIWMQHEAVKFFEEEKKRTNLVDRFTSLLE